MFASNKAVRLTLAAIAVLLGVAPGARAAPPETAAPIKVAIPAQSLGSALTTFARVSGLQVVYVSEVAQGIRTRGAPSNLTPRETLKKLLEGTGLQFKFTNPATVTIFKPPSPGLTGTSYPAGSSGRLPDGPRSTPSAASEGAGSPASLEEVIVTAQKRSQRLQDVPIPVTAISGQDLVDTNLRTLQDYYTLIPGLNVATSSVGGYQLLSIRGITTGLANPSVGITIDDVPYGSSTLYGGNVPPDLDPAEVSQVEVLRGPQGTLYGASSIGGLIKYVTVEPTTQSLSGYLQAGTSGTDHGSDLGYTVDGAVNVPVSDELAFRASAFTREDPGYVDNPFLHIDGLNEDVTSGGHFAALWRPSDLFSIKLSALLQDFRASGSPDVELPVNGYSGPTLGPWQQDYAPGAGAYQNKVQSYAATVRAKIGPGELTSVSGYSISHYVNSIDFSYIYGTYTEAQFPGFAASPLVSNVNARKFSQEIRYNTPLGPYVDWLLGSFYTHEDNSPYISRLLAENPVSGEIGGMFGQFDQPSTYQEYAGFTDLTVHVTSTFDVQLGGRESHILQTNQETDSGPFVPLFEGVPSPNVGPEYRADANAFTYLLTPQYRFSQDLMAYVRLASGYRAGGPNPVLDVPPQYGPDKTYNYEIGVKGDTPSHELSFDASLYYIDWKDIQLTVSNASGLTWTANAGAAKSEGIELSSEARPMAGMKLSGWVALNNAVLTQPLPPGYPGEAAIGNSGDRLPYSAKVSGALSIEQSFPLWRKVTGFVGGTESYAGGRLGVFNPASPSNPTAARQYLPAYARTDFTAGARWDNWKVNAYLNNAFNSHGLIDGGLGTNIPFDFHYLQPRTIGVLISRAF